MGFTDFFKSKTIWGALLAIFAYLAQPDVLAVLPERVAQIVGAIGMVLGAFGIRAAIAKSGPVQ
jgi:hypothetical protein